MIFELDEDMILESHMLSFYAIVYSPVVYDDV